MTSVAAVSAAYLSGLAMSLALAVGAAGARMPSHLELLVSLVPLAVPLALVLPGLVGREARVWQAAWLLGAGAILWLTLSAALPPRPYGDGDIFTQFVAEGRVVPRWLVGSALASWGHAFIWEFPPVATRLPLAIATPAGYLAVLCTLTLCGGAVWLLQRWPRRLAVLLPTLTPIWFLLASGYVEYYPLVAPVFVGVLAWLFEAPLEQRDPRRVGLVAGALPFVYVAFTPIGVLVLAAYAVACGRRAVEAAAVAGLTGVLLVVVCWPEGVPHFARSLYGVMNFGDASLAHRYAGMAGGAGSIFFVSTALLSPLHLGDLAYMYFWGAGWWSLPLALAALVATRGWRVEPRLLLAGGLLAWHLLYFHLMIPRLGPTADIDLFFGSYLTWAFLTGLLCDRLGARLAGQRRLWLMAGLLGASVGVTLFLALVGIPVRS
jgi:hypothetical protein